jgi:predicted porin
LAALAAVGAASAQSSVTLYGTIDVAYAVQTTTTRDGSGVIRTKGVQDGSILPNHIGFRGTEDLGGGLKANFVFEQGLSPTNPALFGTRAASAGQQIDGFSTAAGATALNGSSGALSNGTNRQSFVGLSSATVGTFNIGRQYTALYELSTRSGYLIGGSETQGADKAHVHGQALTGTSTTVRANMIQYISPTFGGGFVARVQYGAGDNRENIDSTTTAANGLTTAKERRIALMLQYANGPVSVAAAYTNVRLKAVNANSATGAAGGATSIYGVVSNPVTFNTTTGVANPIVAGTPLSGLDRTANLFQLGGSYDFGVAKVGGTYNRGQNGGLATSTAAGVPGFNYTYRAYQIGVAVPFGAIVPFISYGRATTDSSNPAGIGATVLAAATNRIEDYKQYQLGVRYLLSKRTTAYAIYGQTKNDAAALAGATSYYIDKRASVGVAHSF